MVWLYNYYNVAAFKSKNRAISLNINNLITWIVFIEIMPFLGNDSNIMQFKSVLFSHAEIAKKMVDCMIKCVLNGLKQIQIQDQDSFEFIFK